MPEPHPLRPALLIVLLALSLPRAGLAQPALADLDLSVTADDIRPQVRIQDYDNRTVEEYSVNGNTYMLKITPNAGAPYYLIDNDGSGDMSWNRGRPALDMTVPQWTLASW
jgi:hypothetical protein